MPQSLAAAEQHRTIRPANKVAIAHTDSLQYPPKMAGHKYPSLIAFWQVVAIRDGDHYTFE
jgi:hypothetical protein